MNEQVIQERVEGRRTAEELLQFIPDDPRQPYVTALVEHITKWAQENGHLPKPSSQQDAQAPPIARLGATVMPFGEHKGKSFDDVPLDYLDWLCGEQEGFYASLRAYLKHPELESRRPHG